jgi:secreted Zn-dependent insulinase-like peptidase
MEENEIDFEKILEQLINKIDKISIKNSLQNKLIINRITEGTVEFITISKVAQLIFKKIENMRYIEEKLSDILGHNVAIKVTFQNKEDYFTNKLENI